MECQIRKNAVSSNLNDTFINGMYMRKIIEKLAQLLINFLICFACLVFLVICTATKVPLLRRMNLNLGKLILTVCNQSKKP